MDLLKGKQVAITGKLAAMTRREAIALIAACGGEFVPAVSPATNVLLVGQGCWPLRKDGRIPRRLQKARQLQIAIVNEDELLAQLGRSDGVHRLYTLAQLLDLVNVPRPRVRAWVHAGLIEPAETIKGIDYFDFRQVVTAKTLCELTEGGVSVVRIQRSLEQLKTWLPSVDEPLQQLALLDRNGQLLVRLEKGLMEPSGQMYLDFEEGPAVLAVEPVSAAEWFEQGCQHEADGFLDEAARAYREALLAGGPAVDICFNLANVLLALGKKREASERYRQVVELDTTHAAAWNNLGVALSDLKQGEEAERAYRRALQLRHGDAHYNLADLLDGQGRTAEACAQWQAFLRHEPHGRWSAYARRRLRSPG